MRPKRLLHIVVLLLLQFTAYGQGTLVPTVGTDFWMAFLNNFNQQGADLQLLISTQSATSGTVEVPNYGWSQNITVVPGAITTVTIPQTIGCSVLSEIVEGKGIHISTLDTVSVFAISFQNFSGDATKVLPTQSLGTEYIVSAYKGFNIPGYDYSSEFIIVATEDGTEIEITPSEPTKGGNMAGVPFTIQLDQGETYQVIADSNTYDLTGSKVVATTSSGSCKPFAVYSGSQCTNIPSNCSYCDFVWDQMLPSNTWSDEFYVVPFNTSPAYALSIVARDNGTSFTLNGSGNQTLNAGEYLHYNAINGPAHIVASGPVTVTQFMRGYSCNGNIGDPAMVVVNGADQKISEVTFGTYSTPNINQHAISIVVETNDVGSVLLDGVSIPTTEFSAFPTDPFNSYASVPVSAGNHTLSAPNGFSAYAHGVGYVESYAYSVGAFQKEELIIDTAICLNDTIFLSPPNPLFFPEWIAFSDTNTIIGTNNQLVLTPPIVSDIYMISGQSSVSGCEEEYTFSVASPISPNIDIIASEDTVCMFENVQMNITGINSGTYNYAWSPAIYFDDPTVASPVLTALSSGWFKVEVTSADPNCSFVSDSIWIEVNGGSIGKLELQANNAQICQGDSAQLSLNAYQVASFDDFDGGIDWGAWSAITAHSISNVCGSVSGDALLFNDIGIRAATTLDMNTSLGGTLDFSLKIANGSAPCDGAESGEDVILYYSNDGGITWTAFYTMYESLYPNFTLLSIPIPLAAQTPSTRFQWRQPLYSGINQDVWALDNVSIQLIDNTGFTFSWAPAGDLNNPGSLSPNVGPIVDTWFVAEVVQGQCDYIDSIFIDVVDFTVNAGSDTVLCFTSGYQMNAFSSDTSAIFSWNQSSVLSASDVLNPTILVDSSLVYTVTGDNGICSRQDSVSVTFVPGYVVNPLTDTTICEGDTVFLDLSGNSNFNWSPITEITNPTSATPLLHPTSDQNYTVTYTTPLNCAVQDSITISVNEIPDLQILINDTTVCAGDSLAIGTTINNVQSPSYLWSSGDSTANIATTNAGIFWVTVNTVCGSDSASVIVSNFTPIQLDLGNDTTICSSDSLVLDVLVPAGGSALWSDNSYGSSYTILSASQVWVEITDSNGCTAIDTINVGQFPATYIDLGVDFDLCSNQTANLDATIPSGANYVWGPGGETTSQLEINSGGTYTVSVMDVNGCFAADTLIVTELTAPTPQIIGDTEYCVSDTLSFTLTENYSTYNWSTESAAPTTELTGNFDFVSISVTSQNGCIGYDTLVLDSYPIPSISLEPYYYICNSEPIEISVQVPNATSYVWDNGMTGPSVTLSEGIYTVTVDAICQVEATTEIIPGEVDFTLGSDRHICHDEAIFLAPQNNEIDSIVWWNNGSVNEIYLHEESFTFGDTVQIIATAYGCGSRTDTLSIYVDDCNCPFFIPNTFTPNADPFNQNLSMGHDCLFEQFEIRIYNRWGEVVFESKSADFIWNGFYNGQLIQDGTYIWQAEYKYAYDMNRTEVYTRTGHLNVVR